MPDCSRRAAFGGGIYLHVTGIYGGLEEALRHATFNIVTIARIAVMAFRIALSARRRS
jgi:hypothetical protein